MHAPSFRSPLASKSAPGRCSQVRGGPDATGALPRRPLARKRPAGRPTLPGGEVARQRPLSPAVRATPPARTAGVHPWRGPVPRRRPAVPPPPTPQSPTPPPPAPGAGSYTMPPPRLSAGPGRRRGHAPRLPEPGGSSRARWSRRPSPSPHRPPAHAHLGLRLHLLQLGLQPTDVQPEPHSILLRRHRHCVFSCLRHIGVLPMTAPGQCQLQAALCAIPGRP